MKMLVVRGVVREGLVVPLGDESLPEGAEVQIVISAAANVVEAVQSAAIFRADDEWNRDSEESWATISWGQN